MKGLSIKQQQHPMTEVEWAGTIALLDRPSLSGNILNKEDYISWPILPIPLWDQGRKAGLVKGMHIVPYGVIAEGTATDPTLAGRLLTGKAIPTSIFVKKIGDKTLITGVIVTNRPAWPGVAIRRI
jgi:hypothetical protein